MLLSDYDILASMATDDIRIDPFIAENVQPASYDLTVGDIAVTRTGPIKLEVTRSLRIGRGETVAVYPAEKLTLSLRLAARFGLSSGLARKGIILLSGLQIDPGYSGRLETVLFNAGHHPVNLSCGERFLSVEFEQLTSPASHGYSGSFKDIAVANSQIIEVISSRHKTFAEFEVEIADLRAQYAVAKWILTGVLVAFLFAILEAFANKAVDRIWPEAPEKMVAPQASGAKASNTAPKNP